MVRSLQGDSTRHRYGLGGDHGLNFVSNRPQVVSRPHHVLHVAFADDLDIRGNAFRSAGNEALVVQDHSGDDVVNEARAVLQAVAVEKEPKTSADVGRFVPSEASCAFRSPQWYPLPGDEGEFALD